MPYILSFCCVIIRVIEIYNGGLTNGGVLMNLKLKRCLEFIAIVVITFVIALSSPLNPFMNNAFTAVQNEILDIARSVRDGYLAYVELDGHYGPVVYEFYGLGFLPTDTHIVQFIMECVIVFATVLFAYKTAKLYTSEIFALITAAILTIFGWGALTHAGAEELMFFIMVLTGYHISRQLKSGYLSHHTYLLTIDLGLVLFLQPAYVWFWVALIIFFAIKFKLDGIDKKKYRSFYVSILEGLLTVAVPMGIYLWYFKNGAAFLQQVVVYNMKNIGTFAEGLKIICGSPWLIMVVFLLIAMLVKALAGENIADLCCWLGIIIIGIIVIALQGENLPSYLELSKALYVVPLASLFSLLDKPFGLKIEERYNK